MNGEGEKGEKYFGPRSGGGAAPSFRFNEGAGPHPWVFVPYGPPVAPSEDAGCLLSHFKEDSSHLPRQA